MTRNRIDREGPAVISHGATGSDTHLFRQEQEHTSCIIEEALPRLVASQFNTLHQMLPPPPQPPFDLDKLLAPPRLVDRAQARTWLLDHLHEKRGAVTFAIEGLSGVCKSSFVSATLHEIRKQTLFPDGMVVMLCSGRRDTAAILRDVLRRFTRSRESLDNSAFRI